MRQANATPASSGWEWGSDNLSTPRPPNRGPSPNRGGSTGAVVAGIVFLGLLAAGGAAYVVVTSGEDEAQAAAAVEAARESAEPASGAADKPATDASPPPAQDDAAARGDKPAPRSLETITWTTDASSTLADLGKTWSIPRDNLVALNPELERDQRLDAGAKVVVYSAAAGASFSIGPPNNGRLTRGVPLPESETWAPPEDRSRAFATAETIASVTTALDTYGWQFPDAEPIQIGDLSARRGGRIYGHQSHQTGLDVDIRLIRDATGEGFDAQRNWFLVKTLIDGGNVTSIFLNATEQAWLRAAAEADVGAPATVDYFALIQHEPGHTIHTHIRFACPKHNKRCVNYPLPDTDEQDSKRKLPSRLGGKTGGKLKLPRRVSKRPSSRTKAKGR